MLNIYKLNGFLRLFNTNHNIFWLSTYKEFDWVNPIGFVIKMSNGKFSSEGFEDIFRYLNVHKILFQNCVIRSSGTQQGQLMLDDKHLWFWLIAGAIAYLESNWFFQKHPTSSKTTVSSQSRKLTVFWVAAARKQNQI